jgi:hypothetical protein
MLGKARGILGLRVYRRVVFDRRAGERVREGVSGLGALLAYDVGTLGSVVRPNARSKASQI